MSARAQIRDFADLTSLSCLLERSRHFKITMTLNHLIKDKLMTRFMTSLFPMNESPSINTKVSPHKVIADSKKKWKQLQTNQPGVHAVM